IPRRNGCGLDQTVARLKPKMTLLRLGERGEADGSNPVTVSARFGQNSGMPLRSDTLTPQSVHVQPGGQIRSPGGTDCEAPQFGQGRVAGSLNCGVLKGAPPAAERRGAKQIQV